MRRGEAKRGEGAALTRIAAAGAAGPGQAEAVKRRARRGRCTAPAADRDGLSVRKIFFSASLVYRSAGHIAVKQPPLGARALPADTLNRLDGGDRLATWIPHVVVISPPAFSAQVGSAGARSASQNGARYVPEGAPGVNPRMARNNPRGLLHTHAR